MDEILERLEDTIRIYQEEIVKLDEFVEYFPEHADAAAIKKDQIEEIIETINEIIEDFT